MKKILLCVAGVLAITASTYLAVAFITLELNALRWKEVHRMGFTYMSLLFSWIGVGVPAVLYRKAGV